jgi:hypothetical protein
MVVLKRGPLSLVSIIEELFQRKNSGCSLDNEITAIGDPPRWLRDTPLSAKVGNTFTDKRRSFGGDTVRTRTQATEFFSAYQKVFEMEVVRINGIYIMWYAQMFCTVSCFWEKEEWQMLPLSLYKLRIRLFIWPLWTKIIIFKQTDFQYWI